MCEDISRFICPFCIAVATQIEKTRSDFIPDVFSNIDWNITKKQQHASKKVPKITKKSRKSGLGVPPRSEKNIKSKKEGVRLTVAWPWERFWRKNGAQDGGQNR